jgi:hypothetical protein
MSNILTKHARFEVIEGLNDLASDLEESGNAEGAELLELAVLFVRAVPDELLSDTAFTEELPADMAGLRALCDRMRGMQIKIADLKAQQTEAKIPFDIMRTKTIPETMEQMEVKSATFAGLGRVQLAADLYCSTKKGEKPAAMAWLRDCGYNDMIAETYNATSMKALIRQLIVDGVEVPEFLNVTPFVRASIVKA